jgi:mRNA interferase YafQ
MLRFARTNQFDRDARRARRRGLNPDDLQRVINLLLREEELPPRHHDHRLGGKYRGFRECHVTPDWLLVYKISGGKLIAARTGSHSDLF